MTMPCERMRSLAWGIEVLSEIQADSQIPAELAVRARDIAGAYPSLDLLYAALDSNAQLPVHCGAAIDFARALFEEIVLSGAGCTQTRRSLNFTLRHFPLRGVGPLLARLPRGEIEQWLARPN